MKATTVSMKRRIRETQDGEFDWISIFGAGKTIDVGSGDDPLPRADPFDKEQGDAQALSTYVPFESYDLLHSSQCLEHMMSPGLAFEEWIAVVKSGGYLVITVPDWELYEQGHWPSKFNPDHKSTWSLTCKSTTVSDYHVYVPTWVESFENIKILRMELIDTNYNYNLRNVDQTIDPEQGVEAWIEIVAQKI